MTLIGSPARKARMFSTVMSRVCKSKPRSSWRTSSVPRPIEIKLPPDELYFFDAGREFAGRSIEV